MIGNQEYRKRVELILEGVDAQIENKKFSNHERTFTVNSNWYLQFKARAEAFFLDVMPRHPLSKEFDQIESINSTNNTLRIKSLLEAALVEIENGFVFDMKKKIQEEIFDDFLEMAHHLMKEKYYVAAASIAGAVLEDKLRNLCRLKRIQFNSKEGIYKLATQLNTAGHLSERNLKFINIHKETRNLADHGEFDKVKANEVEDMVLWVRRFIDET